MMCSNMPARPRHHMTNLKSFIYGAVLGTLFGVGVFGATAVKRGSSGAERGTLAGLSDDITRSILGAVRGLPDTSGRGERQDERDRPS